MARSRILRSVMVYAALCGTASAEPDPSSPGLRYWQRVEQKIEQIEDAIVAGKDESYYANYFTAARNYLKKAKSLDPALDTEALAAKLDALEAGEVDGGKVQAQEEAAYLDAMYLFVTRHYTQSGAASFRTIDRVRDRFLEQAKPFDRQRVYGAATDAVKAGAGPRSREAILRAALEDYSHFVTVSSILVDLNQELDRAQQLPGDQKAKRVVLIRDVAMVFQALAGPGTPGHAHLQPVVDLANDMAAEGRQAVRAVASSDFHVEHVNQIVFSKRPFEPGEESNAGIGETFAPGEAVYATIYFPEKIADVVGNEALGKFGLHEAAVKIENEAHQTLFTGHQDRWEMDMFHYDRAIVIPTTAFSQSYYQFLMIPGTSTPDIRTDVDHSNYTGVMLMKGLEKLTKRTHGFQVKAFYANQGQGISIEGNITFDMTIGAGPKTYTPLIQSAIDQHIASVEFPTSNGHDAGLATQLLAAMDARYSVQDHQQVAFADSDWLITRNTAGQPVYRERKAFIGFEKKLAKGECYYTLQGFRSNPTNGGWTAPEPYGGSYGFSRILCSKLAK